LNHFDKFRDEIKIRIRLIFRVDVLMAIFPRNSSLIEKIIYCSLMRTLVLVFKEGTLIFQITEVVKLL
jgi:hypothetical protein